MSSVSELIRPEPAIALAGLLGVDPPPAVGDDAVPPLWHWLYMLDRPLQADLGPDGHPVRGVVALPPAPGLRRMWAGGRIESHGPLRCGVVASRRSHVASTVAKQGSTGPLVFVEVHHEITQDGAVVIEERQDLVYRTPTETISPSSATGRAEPKGWRLHVTSSLLFQFSALTYNRHRIHYDRGFARDVEGYPGLVVHGPLQALAMAYAAYQLTSRPCDSFEYRLVAPLFEKQGFVVSTKQSGDSMGTTVSDKSGRTTARGNYHPAQQTAKPSDRRS